MSGVVGDFLDESNASRTLAPAAVGTQALLMTGISVRGYIFAWDSVLQLLQILTILCFNLLRPRNKVA